jgi:hypothetical protein
MLTASLAMGQSTLENFSIVLRGDAAVPPNQSSAAGGGVAVYDPGASTISLNIFFSGLSGVLTSAQMCAGPPGVIGPVLADVTSIAPAATDGTFSTGPLPFSSNSMQDLLGNNIYFQISTAAFPNGEIRGQLIHAPEPSGPVLLGLGMGLVALRIFRRRN